MSQQEMKALRSKLFKIHTMSSLPSVPVLLYILATAIDAPLERALPPMGALLIVSMVFVGNVFPLLFIRGLVERAFTEVQGESAGAKLERILKIPRQFEVRMFFLYVLAGTVVLGGATLYVGSSLTGVPVGVAAYVLVILLMFIRQGIGFDETLRPYAIQEFHRNPELKLQGEGLFWTRQSWYLPFAFGLFVLCTVVVMGLIIGRKFQDGSAAVLERLNSMPELASQIRGDLDGIVTSAALPLALVGGFLLVVAAWAAWLIARQQTEGAGAVRSAIQSLASGQPRLPAWVATDEIGDLARATAAVFEQLKTFSLSLRESAAQLGSSAEQLGESNTRQNEVLTLQASALQETQVTAQEIKQTSLLAAQKAEGVLEHTRRADEISRTGESTVEQSLASLQDIREQVMEMATRIQLLNERARQIANITTTVKDLADQSNMLALNAAIEAVRAGENGKGFGVVAREIRSLADQSIKSTQHVREILHDITAAINSAVAMSERGAQKIDKSLEQIRSFGDNIRQMTGIIRENANSVRQISAAVTQQNAGISQIFKAVTDLSHMMDDAMVRLRTTDSTATLVRNVANQVSGFVSKFNWDDSQRKGEEPSQSNSSTG